MHGRLVQFLDELGVLSLALRQLTLLRGELLIDVSDFAVQAGVLTRQLVELVAQLIQVDKAVLLGVGELRPK